MNRCETQKILTYYWPHSCQQTVRRSGHQTAFNWGNERLWSTCRNKNSHFTFTLSQIASLQTTANSFTWWEQLSPLTLAGTCLRNMKPLLFWCWEFPHSHTSHSTRGKRNQERGRHYAHVVGVKTCFIVLWSTMKHVLYHWAQNRVLLLVL